MLLSKRNKGIIYALISASTFGLIPLFAISVVASGMGAPSVLFYRFGISALLMGVMTIASGRSLRVPLRYVWRILVLGALYALTAVGLLLSYNYIASGMATTIHFLYPIVVTTLMVMFFGESKSPWLIVAALLALFGVAVMNWGGSGQAGTFGIGLVLCTVVTYALYIVGVNKSGVGKIDALPLTFYVLLVGAVMFGLYAVFTTGIDAVANGNVWLNLVLLAVVATVISDLTLILAVNSAGSTVTSILGAMEPATAVLVGIFHFGEDFSISTLLGFALILCAMFLVITRTSPKSSAH